MSDHDDIRTLLATYCQLCDDGRFDEFAELFTTDARFTVMGGTQEGREAIKVWMAGNQPPELRGKHLISEPIIDIDDSGGGADCRTDYAFIGRGREGRFKVTSAGRYIDRLRKSSDDGRWRIAHRQIVFLGDPE